MASVTKVVHLALVDCKVFTFHPTLTHHPLLTATGSHLWLIPTLASVNGVVWLNCYDLLFLVDFCGFPVCPTPAPLIIVESDKNNEMNVVFGCFTSQPSLMDSRIVQWQQCTSVSCCVFVFGPLLCIHVFIQHTAT